MSKITTLALIAALCLSLAAADYEWDDWYPSPPLGPRPTMPTSPNDMMQYTRDLTSWCTGCVLRCIVWRNKDSKDCSTECSCPMPPTIVQQAEFLPNADGPEICPDGYAPTPVLSPATNFSSSRPFKRNVVLFLLDDLDELVTPYWEAMPFAKTLFKEKGVHFSNAFSSTSICCAARCQLLTGLYGHNVGVLANSGQYGGFHAFKYPSNQDGTRMKDSQGRCINNEDRSLGVLLQQAGYKTGIWGKFLNGVENDDSSSLAVPIPPGWDEFVVASSRSFYAGYAYTLTKWDSSRDHTDIEYEYFGIKEENYGTDVLRQKTTAWVNKIREQDEHAPMFLFINPTAPHFPIMAAPRHKYATDRWNDLYNATIPVRPNWNEDCSSKPAWLRNTAQLRKTLVDSPWYRLEFVKRMGSLMAVDELIQKVYEKFQEIGELDRTVFIMTADNGYNNGAHLLAHKMAAYDESVRVPMYFSGGGIFQGKTITEPALLIDLAPTILDLANMQPPAHMDGKSWFQNLLVDLEGGETRSQVYLQYKKYHYGAPDDTAFAEIAPAILNITPNYIAIDIPPYRALRTADVLFVENLQIFPSGNTAVEYEAYDMVGDPHQMHNIINQMPQSTFDSLLRDLDKKSTCSGRNCW